MSTGLPHSISSSMTQIQQWTPCLGLPLIWAQFGAERAAQEVVMDQPTVAMVVQGKGVRRMNLGYRQIEAPVAPDVLGVSERGFSVRQGIYSGTPGEIIQVQFPEDAIADIIQDDGACLRLRTQFDVYDGRITWLMRSIWDHQVGDSSNSLYVEGLMLGLVGLLQQNFCQAQAQSSKVAGEFHWKTRRRLIDFIEHALGEPLSVQCLAEEVRMSPQHFARVFAKTFRQPPHAYVMSKRIAAASQLLVNEPERAVTDIALACGFSSAAHFSRSFRQTLGTTPTQWRQQ